MMKRVSVYLLGEERWTAEAAQPERLEILRNVALAARETVSPLERLERQLHPWVSFIILPLFAFANAGVTITEYPLAASLIPAVIVGLVIGKPIGILGASWLAVTLGLAVRPPNLGWPVIGAAGVLCGIGFTMALFIASLAFEGDALAAASLGVLLASLIAAILGLALLRVICVPSPAR
jgi:NhaA family Na+:H+ antiporter